MCPTSSTVSGPPLKSRGGDRPRVARPQPWPHREARGLPAPRLWWAEGSRAESRRHPPATQSPPQLPGLGAVRLVSPLRGAGCSRPGSSPSSSPAMGPCGHRAGRRSGSRAPLRGLLWPQLACGGLPRGRPQDRDTSTGVRVEGAGSTGAGGGWRRGQAPGGGEHARCLAGSVRRGPPQEAGAAERGWPVRERSGEAAGAAGGSGRRRAASRVWVGEEGGVGHKSADESVGEARQSGRASWGRPPLLTGARACGARLPLSKPAVAAIGSPARSEGAVMARKLSPRRPGGPPASSSFPLAP